MFLLEFKLTRLNNINIHTLKEIVVLGIQKSSDMFVKPRTEIRQEFISAYNEWKEGRITATAAMKKSNIPSISTFYRVVTRYENRK